VNDGVIDFHTHVQPSASEGIAFQERFGFEDPPRNGTPEELLPIMDAAGLSRTLMVPWMPAQDLVAERLEGSARDADARERVRRDVVQAQLALNQWAVDTVAKYAGRLECLVGLDPILMSADELRAEVEDKLAKGACGLKIAPMFLNAPPDDERVAIVFEQASRHGVFVLSQSGADGYAGQPAWGHPSHFEEVLRAWPDVDIQLAHLGFGAEAEVARLTDRYPNLYADTSARLYALGAPGEWTHAEAAEWFRRIGIERVVFGTNYPMHDPAGFIAAIRAMPLRDDERERILYQNAAGILERTRRSGGG